MSMTEEMEFARMKSLGWGIYLEGEKNGEIKGERRGVRKGERRGVKRGLKKGEALHALSSIQTLMETMNLTREQAMEALKISETEYQQYLKLAGK